VLVAVADLDGRRARLAHTCIPRGR
jgi:hypothetical protein